ncbi:hypothetical protein DL770_010751 [Monosporascus sp. CRB-9-2]|nr:hypothetical protein DL770_010751 [Monosporascus sp. CRB-9-2]
MRPPGVQKTLGSKDLNGGIDSLAVDDSTALFAQGLELTRPAIRYCNKVACAQHKASSTRDVNTAIREGPLVGAHADEKIGK